jgi:5-methylcytosine-specific restriction protein A
MPSVPTYTHCLSLGCKNQRSKLNHYCSEHGGKDSTPNTGKRKQDNALYSSEAWKIMRVAQLSEQPLCQACLLEGRVESAQHVDHVFRWQHIGRHAFYTNLFQSLCQPHHSHKTSIETQGIYEHYAPDGLKQYQVTDYGYATQKNEG